MNETCDRCGPAVHAIYRADRDAELYLCGHYANQLRPALSAQGWSVRLTGEHELAPRGRVAKPGELDPRPAYYAGWPRQYLTRSKPQPELKGKGHDW